jgi:chorismate mutase/prephenate dehydratase
MTASRSVRAARRQTLAHVRSQIDRLDERLLSLISRRAALALLIGRIKRQQKWPVYDARREQFVLRHVTQRNRGPLSPSAIRHIFQAILSECRRRQRRRRTV